MRAAAIVMVWLDGDPLDPVGRVSDRRHGARRRQGKVHGVAFLSSFFFLDVCFVSPAKETRQKGKEPTHTQTDGQKREHENITRDTQVDQ